MTWLAQLAATSPIAHAIGILSLVCVAGMVVGSVKARGIGLGTSGVLFAGLRSVTSANLKQLEDEGT